MFNDKGYVVWVISQINKWVEICASSGEPAK